jgi:thiazole synthase
MEGIDKFIIAGKEFSSRLIIGSGKFKNFHENANAAIASGAEIITVAVRRVNLDANNGEMLQDYICPKKYLYLPNTAGCHDAISAVRVLRLARELGGWNLVKLEVISNDKSLYPDMIETLKALEMLKNDGFAVMVYSTDDPIICMKLQDMGADAIMPLAAPIGSGLGLQNKLHLQMIRERISVPLLVDAGIGTPSDAMMAMEMGFDAVLLNTAIAEAKNPILMAEAFKLAVIAGRKAFLAGRMPKRAYASASSPLDGLIG